jgi:hypothetical protein
LRHGLKNVAVIVNAHQQKHEFAGLTPYDYGKQRQQKGIVPQLP